MISGIDHTSTKSKEEIKWLFTQIISLMIIIYLGLIVCVTYNMAKPGSNTG